jgi:hypothetical protein
MRKNKKQGTEVGSGRAAGHNCKQDSKDRFHRQKDV